MRRSCTPLICLLGSTVSAAGSWWGGQKGCVQIQHEFSPFENAPGSENYRRAEAVKDYYVEVWNQYADHAFGNDSFNPSTNMGSSGSGGWGSFIVDSMDTAIVMGLKDIVDRQLAWLAEQDFTKSIDPQIDIFDSTILLLAGQLSAHDLITSGKVPYADTYNREHVEALVRNARNLADLLSPVFDSPSGLPWFFLEIATHNASHQMGASTAIAGTLIYEWHRLSDLTGDPKYRNLADKAESYLIHPKPQPLYPDLIGSQLDMTTGDVTTRDVAWKSGIDSFYEYLIKVAIYDPSYKLANEYKSFWTTAVESTREHIAVHPYGFPDVTFITETDNDGVPNYTMDDYTCFAGGNILLGGAYLDRNDFKEFGLELTDSCHRLYNTTVSGLNPLTIGFYGPNGTASNPAYNGNGTTAQQARAYYEKAGGYFVNFEDNGFAGLYTLYPEPIESIFYAYRITGDSKWQDYNWGVFESIKADCDRGSVTATSVSDVTQPMGGDISFFGLPSYFLAETLKYQYLTYSSPDLVSLDDFQFNTQCHPMRVQGGTCSTSVGVVPWPFSWWKR